MDSKNPYLAWEILIACAFFMFLFMAASAYFYLNSQEIQSSCKESIFSLSSSLAKTQGELNEAQTNYSAAKNSLLNAQHELELSKNYAQQTEAELEGTRLILNNTLVQLNSTSQQLEATQARIFEIKQELAIMEKELNSSMDWFRQNSQLPQNYSWEVDIFNQRIIEDCVYENTLNLACINYLNENTVLQLRYLEDLDAGEADHLQSVWQTISRQGGDCEDYALFFKAILNSIKASGANYSISTWINGDGEYRVWPKSPEAERYYYYTNANSLPVANLQDVNPYVICYVVDSYSGHCRVALSPAKINSSSQLYLLNGAAAFETQNGKYGGQVGRDYVLCASSQQACYNTPGSIILVISDDNIFSIQRGGWSSYSDYLPEISKFARDLDMN